jgi:hypothetical protein
VRGIVADLVGADSPIRPLYDRRVSDTALATPTRAAVAIALGELTSRAAELRCTRDTDVGCQAASSNATEEAL